MARRTLNKQSPAFLGNKGRSINSIRNLQKTLNGQLKEKRAKEAEEAAS